MKIRPYRDTDRDAIVQLWRDCGLIVPHNDPVRDIERKLKVDPKWFLVGTENKTLVASCMIGYEGHRAWVNYLAVSPNHRRKGYAKSLMLLAEERLKAIGCPKINLQIRSADQSVRAFYESLGYAIDPVISMGKRLIPDNQPRTIL